MRLRPALEADVSELAALYADSIRGLGPECYGPEAVEAWAAFSRSLEFRDFIMKNRTLVAETGTGIAGFGGIDESGRIASLFVRPDQSRKGIGSALLTALLDLGSREGVTGFRTEASELSRPLFEKFGFAVLESEVVERAGVSIKRYRMEGVLRPQPPESPRAAG